MKEIFNWLHIKYIHRPDWPHNGGMKYQFADSIFEFLATNRSHLLTATRLLTAVKTVDRTYKQRLVGEQIRYFPQHCQLC